MSLVQARVRDAVMQAAETGQCCVRVSSAIMPDCVKAELEELGYQVTLEMGSFVVRW